MLKCPKCDMELQKVDIEDVRLRGIKIAHYVYVCKKCNYIIGCGAYLKK